MIKYKYHANVRGIDITCHEVKDLTEQINAALGFPIVTTHILHNYFLRPEKMQKQAAKLKTLHVRRERLPRAMRQAPTHGFTSGWVLFGLGWYRSSLCNTSRSHSIQAHLIFLHRDNASDLKHVSTHNDTEPSTRVMNRPSCSMVNSDNGIYIVIEN